jgi:two-component system, sensor histidine kinase PdtaS
MKNIFCFLLFLSSSVLCYSQTKIDTLKSLLAHSTKNDVNEVYHLSSIGWHFMNANQFDSAIYYYRKALKEKNSSTDIALIASTFNGIGVAFSSTGYTDSSIYYYKKALSLYKDIRDTTNSIVIDSNLSIIYKNKGMYEKSLEHAFDALTKLESQKPDRPLASCYNTIGSVYANTGDYQKALIFYRKSLGIRTQINYVKGIGQAYNNIGEVHISLRQYDSALFNLYKSLDMKQRNGEAAPTVLNNIGEVLLKLNRPKEAEQNFIKSLTIHKNGKDQIGQIIGLNNLVKIKLLEFNVNGAEKYLDQSERLVFSVGSIEYQKQYLELKVKLYEAKKDYPIAFKYSQQLLLIKDSLLNKEKAEGLLNMQVRYETEQKEQQITFLEQEKELQRAELKANRSWIQGLFISATLLVIIILLILNQYRLSQKSKSKVEFLLKELNHRVKNNLQILSSLLSLQSQQLTDQNALNAVKSSEGRVNAMALIHKKLYTDNQNQKVNIKEYISELVQYLSQSYGFANREFKLILNVDAVEIDVDKAIRLGLIINELVSNAFKYAYAGQDNPALILNLKIEKSQNIVVEVIDNGKGILEDFNSVETFGLKMVKTLTKELRAKLNIYSDHGTHIILTIPI